MRIGQTASPARLVAIGMAFVCAAVGLTRLQGLYGKDVTPSVVGSSAAPPSNGAHAAFAEHFLQMLVMNPVQLRRDGLFWRPAYMKVAKLYKAGHYRKALAQFYSYYLQKFSTPEKYGLPSALANPSAEWGTPPFWVVASIFDPNAPRSAIIAAADDILQGKVNLFGTVVNIGPPGTVNWNYPFPAGQKVPGQLTLAQLREYHGQVQPNVQLTTLAAFDPLVQAYLITRDRKYVTAWADYLRDWLNHCSYFKQLNPLLVPDGINAACGSSAIRFMRLLQAVGSCDPEIQTDIPPHLFAGVLAKMYTQLILPTITYIRSNTHNWTPASATGVINPIVFDEFAASHGLFREIIRRSIESVASTEELRDGSETQQDPWYDQSDYDHIWWANRLMQTHSMNMPGWQQALWQRRVVSNIYFQRLVQRLMRRKVTFLIHLQTSQGQWPITFRGDKRSAMPPSYLYSPQAYQNPVNFAIMQAIYNPTSGIVPPYTSEWFPYCGLAIMRDGWKPTSGYGALFCSPHPGAYGGYRSRSDNNSFGLNAYGQDLLVNNTTGHYMYPTSPITVDGMNQFFHAGVYKVPSPSGHKVFEVVAWYKPAPWRWYASKEFNLAEGVYSGRWGSLHHPRTVAGPYGPDQSMQGTLTRSQTFGGITYQRLVMQVRPEQLWILTDRLLTKAAHTYTQIWRLPVTPGGMPAFEPQNIHINMARRSITTHQGMTPLQHQPEPQGWKAPKWQQVAMANVALYQFTHADISYSSRIRKMPLFHYKNIVRLGANGWEHIAVKWKGDGNQQIVTAILPAKPGAGKAGRFKSIKQITSGAAGVGFKAVLPDGKVVVYLSSPKPGDTLTYGAVQLTGQALLLAGDQGMALNCRTLTINGKAVNPGRSNFAFDLRDGLLAAVKPIYRPIEPVQISPNVNAFEHSLKVSLSTPTPGVQIRYTTDGTTPTPHSMLYTAPFTLTHTALVQARAYRPGVTHNPYQTSGTEATPVIQALFHRVSEVAALPAWTIHRSKPGADCQYYQANYQQLWLNLRNLTPQKTGVVSKLWDMAFIPADNPPVGTALAPRQKYYALVYHGYLNVPASGMYTFYAPKAYYTPSTDPGYRLELFVGPDRAEPNGMTRWNASERVHAFGTWSVALAKGLHPFKIVYVDYRRDSAKLLNRKGLAPYIWPGVAPHLDVSGPNISRQRIPADWLWH